MLNSLKEKNPGIQFFSVYDAEFAKYGRIIKGIDTAELIKTASSIKNPETGSNYVTSEPKFEVLEVTQKVKKELFGGIDIQMGYCFGHNSILGATEWHTSSEINVAVTPLVLLLALRTDILDDKIDSSKFKAFLVPEGTVIEVYATTLHFCPCEVQPEGFGCVVGLPIKTNILLDFDKEDKLLYKYNKWVLAHAENTGMIANGAVCGITGVNYEIKY